MPMITFTCKGKGCSTRQWEGSLEILKRGNPCEAELCARGSRFHLIVVEILQRGNPCEAELCARGSRFHLIVGRHSYGNYRCIPNWDVGTELTSLTELFWNEECLRHYSRMKKADG